MLDTPGPVRKENQLDLPALETYLKTHIAGLSGPITLRQFRGGASNLTYQVDAGDRSFVLRCAPDGAKARGAHDMGREFRIQQLLKPAYPLAPAVLAWDSEGAIMGKEAYLMEKMEGIILRKNLPPGLSLTPAQTRQLCCSALDALVRLHQLDYRAAGLDAFGKGQGYAERQVIGWRDRYGKARTWNTPRFTRVIRWLEGNLPKQERTCFIHNDFRFDNLVLDPADPTRIIGVLDWEMATVGEPLMDLGNSLAYWVEATDDFVMKSFRRQPTHLPGMLSRREAIAYYCEKMGYDPGEFTFFEVCGLFRLAAIAQQIYYRYYLGQTKNKAFRPFWIIVNYLHWRCERAIRESSSQKRA